MGGTTEPVYLRVLDDLRSRIRSGSLPPGARVPSRNAIMANFGVGETAAKHALAVLTAEGLIESRAGSGSYVRKPPSARYLDHDRPHFPGSPFGMREWPDSRGDSCGDDRAFARRLAWEHRTEQETAPPVIAERLGVAAAAPVTVTRYLLYADGEPVQFAVSYEPAALTSGTEIAVPEQGPLAGRGVIERMRSIGVAVDHVAEEISARPALRPEAEALALPPGSLVVVVERTHHSAGRAVETGEVVVSADRFKLRYRFDADVSGTA